MTSSVGVGCRRVAVNRHRMRCRQTAASHVAASATLCLLISLQCLSPVTTADISYIDAFKLALDKLANEGLGVEAYQQYVDNELYFDTPSSDGRQLVDQIAIGLRDRLLAHKTMIRQLRDVIEDSLQEASDVTVPSCCNVSANSYDVRFRTKTDVTSMCVHNSLGSSKQPFWSSVLAIMKRNLVSVPTLRWQYFGTEDSLLYLYPAFPSATSSGDCNNFDPRQRPWYQSTLGSRAKDVVVLIQKSSSSHSLFCSGEQSIVAEKSAANIIIEALNSKDKVGVLAFSDDVTSAVDDSCYSRQLATVNPSTRTDLTQFINSLQADDSDVNYTRAFAAAFSLLNSSVESDDERRDRVIVLLTNADYIHQDINKTLAAIRDGNRPFRNKVAIFVYTFQHGGSTDNEISFIDNIINQISDDISVGNVAPGLFVEMQCADIRSQMTSYFERFVNVDRNAPITYTVPYYDKLQVGLIISLCAPVVIDRSITIRGVTCVDVTIDSLFSEVQYFQQSLTSYAFLMDGYGRLLLHPLLPQPQTLTQDAQLPDITAIEYNSEDGILELRNRMMNNASGQLRLRSRKVFPRGESVLMGVKYIQVDSTYYWRQVNGSNFTVCVVVSDGDQNSLVSWKDATFPPVGLIDIERLDAAEPTRCAQFGRVALKDHSSVKLPPRTFISPATYLDVPANQSVMHTWKDYLEGRTSSSPDIKPGIRDVVASTYKLEEIWNNRNACMYPGWLHYGSKEGVFRKIPGTRMTPEYDPTRRPWYQQAAAAKTDYSLYGQYMDASGAGCVMSIDKAITRKITGSMTGDIEVIGVLGVVFTAGFFNDILMRSMVPCSQSRHECFVVDQSGYVILHSSFLSPSTKCDMSSNQHITCIEPEIAQELIRQNVLVIENCISYVNLNKLKFWKIQLSALVLNTSDSSVTVYQVPGSNIYIVDKYRQKPSSATCPSLASSSCQWTNAAVPSEAPCYLSTEYRQQCVGELAYSRSIPPCIPPAIPLNNADFQQEEKVYVDKLCPCNSSCFDPDSCLSKQSQQPATELKLLGLLALVILPVAVLIVVLTYCINRRPWQKDNRKSSQENFTGPGGTPGELNPAYVSHRDDSTDYDYIHANSSTTSIYLPFGPTEDLSVSSTDMSSPGVSSESANRISAADINSLPISFVSNSVDNIAIPIKFCLDGPETNV